MKTFDEIRSILHAYFGVSFRTVCETVKDEFPSIEPLVASLLEDIKKHTGK